MIDANIEGVDQLNKALKLLPGRVAKRALRAATQSAARVIVKEAKKRVPVDTGELKRNIRAKKTGGGSNFVKITVYLTDKAFYGKFIEFGTKYKAPRPFLRPAVDENKDQILKKLGERLWHRIKIEADKLNGA